VAQLKTYPTILAAAVMAVLVLSPLTATAAGTISFTAPASGTSLSGTATLNIAGTVSPAPAQTDSVTIFVKNPSGSTVWSDLTSVNPTTGAFTDSTTTGGPSYTASGTYTISATDSFSAAGSTTFTYQAPGYTPPFNTTRALINIERNQTIILAQLATLQKDMKGNATQEQTAMTSISGAIATLTTNLNTLSGSVTTLNNAVTGISSQVTSIANQVGSINTAVQGLGTQVGNAATQAKAAADAVSSTQTYVLVVAVLAAITLVLELAILVRKLS
jgi:hypothetical protein